MATVVQKALHTCSVHEHEETEMYFRTCKKPVCIQCVKREHKEHGWDSMKNVAKILRAETKQRKLEMESISKSIVMGVTEVLDSVSDRANQQFSSNCNELESMRKELVRYVNKEVDEMKAKCKEYHETKAKVVQEQRDKLKRKENRMNFLIHEMETGATDFTHFDLIEMHDELKRLLTDMQSLAEIPSDLHNNTVYARGSFDISIIRTLLGSVEEKHFSQNPILKHIFKYSESEDSETFIRQIFPMTENEVWVHTNESALLKLVDSKGNEKRSVNLNCESMDFTVAENDIIFFLDADTKCVKAIDRDAKITLMLSTAALVPSSIYLLRSGDLLLCSVDKETADEVKCFVRRMSSSGDVIKGYEIWKDGQNSNKSYPAQVIEHFNGNIDILMWYFEEEEGEHKWSTIFSIDHEETIVFRYGDKEDPLCMTSICCDIRGTTLAAEPDNNRILVIDAKGSLFRYLFTEESFDTIPFSLALFGNTLWIGNSETGMIEVYNYAD